MSICLLWRSTPIRQLALNHQSRLPIIIAAAQTSKDIPSRSWRSTAAPPGFARGRGYDSGLHSRIMRPQLVNDVNGGPPVRVAPCRLDQDFHPGYAQGKARLDRGEVLWELHGHGIAQREVADPQVGIDELDNVQPVDAAAVAFLGIAGLGYVQTELATAQTYVCTHQGWVAMDIIKGLLLT